MKTIIKTKLMLKCPEDLWMKFKSQVTKDKNMNDAVVDLIKKKTEPSEDSSAVQGVAKQPEH